MDKVFKNKVKLTKGRGRLQTLMLSKIEFCSVYWGFMQALCLCRHCDACVPFEAFTWAKNALVEGQKASGKKFFCRDEYRKKCWFLWCTVFHCEIIWKNMTSIFAINLPKLLALPVQVRSGKLKNMIAIFANNLPKLLALQYR